MKKCINKNSINKSFNIFSKIISFFLVLSTIVAVSYVIYFEILPLAFLSLMIIIGGVVVFLLVIIINSKLKKWIRTIFIIVSIIISIVCLTITFYSIGTLNMFDNILDLGIRNDNYSVYVLKEKEYKDLEDLKDKNIGLLKEGSKEIKSKLSKKIDFKAIEYDNSIEMINNLDEEIDAVVLLDTTMELLQETNEDYKNLRSVYSFAVTTKVETINKNVDMSKDSFLVYISGVDTNGTVDSKARSDVNILVAVNPTDKKILMLNTPRDFYVELPSKEDYDKLTHAGIYGIEESILALEKLYDTTVNYYVRVNFTTFIEIVDALGGIRVDVPNSFCEQTSSRESDEEICLRKGIQTLDGEEALALTRTRHIYADGDRSRIKNQMLVLEALIDKAISPKIITSYSGIISKVSDSVITNIGEKDITKLIKNQINENSSWSIETYSVNGIDSSEPIYSAGSLNTYVMKPDIETVIVAKEKLRGVLGTN